MKSRTVLDGILCAFAVTALTAPAWWALQQAFSPEFAFRVVLLGAHLGYLFWLLRGASRRAGNLTLAAANLLISAVLAFLSPAPGSLAAILAVMLALNRTLLFHKRIAAVLLDGLLVAAGLMFASYLVTRGGGLVVGLWGFLLLQSLHVLMPRVGVSAADPPASSFDRFSHAHRQAQGALQRLAGDNSG